MPAEPAAEVGADRSALGSAALACGTIDAVSPKFAEGLARVREVRPARGPLLPPVPQPAALLDHALDSLHLLGSGAPLYLTPLLWDE